MGHVCTGVHVTIIGCKGKGYQARAAGPTQSARAIEAGAIPHTCNTLPKRRHHNKKGTKNTVSRRTKHNYKGGVAGRTATN